MNGVEIFEGFEGGDGVVGGLWGEVVGVDDGFEEFAQFIFQFQHSSSSFSLTLGHYKIMCNWCDVSETVML